MKKQFSGRVLGVRAFVRRHFAQIERNGELSGAHNFDHLERVGKYAKEIAKALGADDKTAELAHVAGLLHDFVRNKAAPTNTITDDEVLSAEQAKPLLERNPFSSGEIDVIIRAIKTHSVPREILAREDRHKKPQGEKLIRLAVWLADKTEANGSFVIARRSQFVAGERFHEGDLAKWRASIPKKIRPKINSHIAFLLEGYVRRYIKNDAALYPNWYRPVSDELFKQQRDFVKAVYAGTNTNEEEIEALLSRYAYPGVKKAEVAEAKEKRLMRKDAISAKDIVGVSLEDARAALAIIDHFADKKHRSLDTGRAIRMFKAKNPRERYWHDLMKGYLDGGLKRKIEAISRQT